MGGRKEGAGGDVLWTLFTPVNVGSFLKISKWITDDHWQPSKPRQATRAPDRAPRVLRAVEEGLVKFRLLMMSFLKSLPLNVITVVYSSASGCPSCVGGCLKELNKKKRFPHISSTVFAGQDSCTPGRM